MQSYYTTIPSYITTRNDLTDSEKLFYGTVQSLCCKYGFCWASNETLAQISHKSPRQVRRHIHKLQKLGLLIVELEYNNERKIWTRETWPHREELKKSFNQDFEFNQRFTRVDMDDQGGWTRMTTNIDNKITITKNKEDEARAKPPAPPPVHLSSKNTKSVSPPRQKEKPPSNYNAQTSKELTYEDRETLRELMGSELLKKYEEKRREHLKKCPKSYHHKKKASETIREWYTQDCKEKNERAKALEQNKTRASINREAKSKEFVEEILRINPHLQDRIRPNRNDIDFLSPTSGGFMVCATFSYDNPNFYDNIKDILIKMKVYDGIDLMLPRENDQ